MVIQKVLFSTYVMMMIHIIMYLHSILYNYVLYNGTT